MAEGGEFCPQKPRVSGLTLTKPGDRRAEHLLPQERIHARSGGCLTAGDAEAIEGAQYMIMAGVDVLSACLRVQSVIEWLADGPDATAHAITCFEHNHIVTRVTESECGRETGQAAANDRDICP